jgi:hypothetical protein
MLIDNNRPEAVSYKKTLSEDVGTVTLENVQFDWMRIDAVTRHWMGKVGGAGPRGAVGNPHERACLGVVHTKYIWQVRPTDQNTFSILRNRNPSTLQ